MGKQTSVFQFEGRLGEVTGYRDMRGNQLVRKIVKASNPQTALQVAQRTRFLTATGAAAGLKNAIAGLVPTAKSKRLTPRNTLVQMLLTNPDAIKTITREGTTPDGTPTIITEAVIEPKFVQLSRGMLEMPSVTASVEGFSLKISIGENETCDNLHLVYFDRFNNHAVAAMLPVEHGMPTTLTVDIPNIFRDQKVAIYVYGQAIGDNLSRALYQSVWNGNSVQAKATRRTIEAGAEYSETTYLGEFTIDA